MQSNPPPLRLNLIDHHGGSTSIHLDVTLNERGDIVLEGQDIGAAPAQAFGDSDYEYWITVPAAEKDRLILNLIQVHFRNDTAGRDFVQWLKGRGIPYVFHSF